MKVKNTKQQADTWCGMEIQPGAYYELEAVELHKWQNDSKVLTDIGSGDLVMNNGTSDILDVATAINHLKEITDKFNTHGHKIVAPTAEDLGGMTTVWKGSIHTAVANSLNIFDEPLTTEQKLRGGWFKVLSGASVGDYVECSIVDKDDVLGLFSLLGLTLGVDVLELKKYVKTEYVAPEDKNRQEFHSSAASEVIAGLYMRVAYLNSGNSDVIFTVTRKYHEA